VGSLAVRPSWTGSILFVYASDLRSLFGIQNGRINSAVCDTRRLDLPNVSSGVRGYGIHYPRGSENVAGHRTVLHTSSCPSYSGDMVTSGHCCRGNFIYFEALFQLGSARRRDPIVSRLVNFLLVRSSASVRLCQGVLSSRSAIPLIFFQPSSPRSLSLARFFLLVSLSSERFNALINRYAFLISLVSLDYAAFILEQSSPLRIRGFSALYLGTAV